MGNKETKEMDFQRIESNQNSLVKKKVFKAKTHYKVGLFGGSRVGKTSIFYRFISGSFQQLYAPTHRVQIGLKLYYGNELLSIELWDLPADENNFNLLTDTYMEKLDGAMIITDMANGETFGEVQKWKQCFRNQTWPPGVSHFSHAYPFSVILLANKCDAELLDFTPEEVKNNAKDNEFDAGYSVSAKKNLGISSSFKFLLEKMMERDIQRQEQLHEEEEERKTALDVTQVNAAIIPSSFIPPTMSRRTQRGQNLFLDALNASSSSSSPTLGSDIKFDTSPELTDTLIDIDSGVDQKWDEGLDKIDELPNDSKEIIDKPGLMISTSQDAPSSSSSSSSSSSFASPELSLSSDSVTLPSADFVLPPPSVQRHLS
eukprot:TRINITY_DN194_c0_g4_i1.p2 TRINITY_DN194_c0_g4~~TRINITY_DN194_c0_g4_i1.p2  ORF type:complete len:373 (+),score=104.10 TRINITY_DN194_c0_g4_i1:144-1262(+)